MHDDTDRISSDSVKSKSFADVNFPRSNLNHNNRKFYVPPDPKLILKPHSTNPNNKNVRPSTSCYIPKKLNNQV